MPFYPGRKGFKQYFSYAGKNAPSTHQGPDQSTGTVSSIDPNPDSLAANDQAAKPGLNPEQLLSLSEVSRRTGIPENLLKDGYLQGEIKGLQQEETILLRYRDREIADADHTTLEIIELQKSEIYRLQAAIQRLVEEKNEIAEKLEHIKWDS
ncbi:MAG: hypothetical protein AAF530_14435 [Pseudomonadota bacterium]